MLDLVITNKEGPVKDFKFRKEAVQIVKFLLWTLRGLTSPSSKIYLEVCYGLDM